MQRYGPYLKVIIFQLWPGLSQVFWMSKKYLWENQHLHTYIGWNICGWGFFALATYPSNQRGGPWSVWSEPQISQLWYDSILILGNSNLSLIKQSVTTVTSGMERLTDATFGTWCHFKSEDSVKVWDMFWSICQIHYMNIQLRECMHTLNQRAILFD